MKYFKDSEFECKCGCGKTVIQEVKDRADAAREFLGAPMSISSGARCVKHNKDEGGASKSRHLTGEAIDVKVFNSRQRYLVFKALERAGFTGFDIQRDYVHADTGRPETVIFKYR